MVSVTFHCLDGRARQVTAGAGVNLMEAATQQGIPGIWGQCGGAASCATCHVYVGDDFAGLVGSPDELEDDMLDGILAERRPNSRLSCQITLSGDLDGLAVEVAPED